MTGTTETIKKLDHITQNNVAKIRNNENTDLPTYLPYFVYEEI